ncbi:hypothetical protein MMC29_004092 [Sticta canariensis]|nr:hypothetical protein [Sticta canariensis]
MFQPLFACVFLIPPFIHGIPYGVFDSDGTTIGIQQLDLPSLLFADASTAQPLDAAVNLDASNPPIPAPDTSNLYSSTTDTSIPISSTTDTSNSGFLTTDASHPSLLSAGLNDPTYTFNAPESQDNNGGVPTDDLNGGGLTDTFEIAGQPYRRPPAILPADKPRHDTPNCDGQLSQDRTHERFLSCCNADKTQCVYFKFSHDLCDLRQNWRGPLHPIQCCSDVPVEGQPGVECQNANNPFRVHIPAIGTPFGPTPEIKFKVNIPEAPVEPVRGVKIGPVEIPPGAVP